LTHTQARAPTDQRAPITPIGALAYLANLGRAADQIGGYLRAGRRPALVTGRDRIWIWRATLPITHSGMRSLWCLLSSYRSARSGRPAP